MIESHTVRVENLNSITADEFKQLCLDTDKLSLISKQSSITRSAIKALPQCLAGLRSYIHGMKIKRTNMRYEHKIKRDEQKAAGVFDGRFKQRVVIDKKKQAKRDWARLRSQI